MKSRSIPFFVVVTIGIILSLFVMGTVHAQTPDPNSPPVVEDGYLKNPLRSDLNTIPRIVVAILDNMILPIAIPFVAIMIIVGGFRFVIARGKPEEIKKAKEGMLWTLIGAAVVLGAYLVSRAIEGTIREIKDGQTTAIYQHMERNIYDV